MRVPDILDTVEYKEATSDNKVNCAYCEEEMYDADGLYDDYKEQYYCDSLCFFDWASDNEDIITTYYLDRNCTGN